jgi:hypothetical protein
MNKDAGSIASMLVLLSLLFLTRYQHFRSFRQEMETVIWTLSSSRGFFITTIITMPSIVSSSDLLVIFALLCV